MRCSKSLLLALLSSVFVISAVAKDLGVVGTVWPITEVDIRKLLVEDAAKVDWSQAQEGIKDGAKKYVDSLPKRQLGRASRTQTVWMDPSIVITSDIQAPVQNPDGSYSWKLLAAKGSRVNPLEKFRPVTAFLMFDGSDKDQLELVKQVLAKEPTRLIPVEAGAGNVNDSNKYLKRGVFHANDAMVARFKPEYLPSLVYPGYGAKELYIGVTSYAAPYKVDEVLSTWPTLGFGAKPPSKEAAR